MTQTSRQRWMQLLAEAGVLVSALAHTVASAGVPMLSHDDDTIEKIDLIRTLGIGACEFSITLEAARKN